MSTVDPAAWTYLYTGTIACLTVETKVIIATILYGKPFGEYVQHHSQADFYWAIGGALLTAGFLVWFTGLRTVESSSVATLTAIGLFAGVVSFSPVPSMKQSVPQKLVQVKDGRTVISKEALSLPRVKAGLGLDDETTKKDGFIVRRVKKQIANAIPGLKKSVSNALDNAMLDLLGYERMQYVVLPQSVEKTPDEIAVMTAEDDLVELVQKEVAAAAVEELKVVNRTFNKVNPVAVAEIAAKVSRSPTELGTALSLVFRSVVDKLKFVAAQNKRIDRDTFRKEEKRILDILQSAGGGKAEMITLGSYQ